MRDGIECQVTAPPMSPVDQPRLSRRMIMTGAFASSFSAGAGVAYAGPAPAPAQSAGNTNSNDEIGTVWWVELVTNDEIKAADLYGEAIGWKTKTADGGKQAATDAGYTLFVANGNEVAGALRADKDAMAKNKPMWIVYFQVDNVENAISRTIAKGGRLLVPSYDVPGSARMALLSDTDGVAFGVAAPL